MSMSNDYGMVDNEGVQLKHYKAFVNGCYIHYAIGRPENAPEVMVRLCGVILFYLVASLKSPEIYQINHISYTLQIGPVAR